MRLTRFASAFCLLLLLLIPCAAYAAAPAAKHAVAPAPVSLPTLSGTAQSGATLTLTNGSWSGGPNTYTDGWRVCNTDGLGCQPVAGAFGSTLALNNADVGHTMRGVVFATNAAGTTKARANSTAIVVAAGGAAPTSISAPALSGSAQSGQTLSSTTGTWTGTPTGYAYQWQLCGSGGSGCANIGSATQSTLALGASDVGDTVRALLTASNSGGSGSAPSVVSAVVSGGSSGTLNCFSNPSACGYPSATTTGVTNCSSLPNQSFAPADLPAGDYYYSGSGNTIEITGNNVTIANTNIGNWQFYLNSVSGTTFNNDCLSPNSGGNQADGQAIGAFGSTSHTTVENSTIVPAGCSIAAAATSICTSSGVEQTLAGGGADTLINNDVLVGAVEDVNGIGNDTTVENSYIVANGYQNGGHGEDIFAWNNIDGLTVSHNTLLNPFMQTAEVFIAGPSGGTCESMGTNITGNLMAGGGFTIYQCSGTSSFGPATLSFTDNDIARCDGTIHQDTGHQETYYCGTVDPDTSQYGSADGAGQDSHGYFPYGGGFGMTAYTNCGANTTWSGNFWDDTGASVACS